MATVSPYLRQGRWVVDLRAWGFGQRYTLSGIPPEESARESALHAAYELLMRLRQGVAVGSPPPRTQEVLPGTAPGGGLSGDCLFRFAIDEWAPRQQWKSEGGAAWGEQYTAAVRRELGGLRIAQFEAPTGDDLLLGWIRGLKEKGLSPASRRNRLSIAGRVLGFAKRRGWLTTLPEIPRATEGKEKRPPIPFTPYTEEMFRAIRAALFNGPRGIRFVPVPKAQAEDYVARRRLYLSWAFYTGMHTADIDALTPDLVMLDFGSYMRVNTKSSKYVPNEPFDMPEGLALDCKAELERLGRYWRPGELICGGEWRNGIRTLNLAAKRAGLPPFDLRTVARRSTVWNLALLGWPEEHCSRVLGHVDRKMISTVYRQYVPVKMRAPAPVPWTVENATKMPWRTDKPKAAVLTFERPARQVGGDSDDE